MHYNKITLYRWRRRVPFTLLLSSLMYQTCIHYLSKLSGFILFIDVVFYFSF